ncbi:MAG: hypothetical protein ACLRWQ_15500 [Flavonifractor plautii]
MMNTVLDDTVATGRRICLPLSVVEIDGDCPEALRPALFDLLFQINEFFPAGKLSK